MKRCTALCLLLLLLASCAAEPVAEAVTDLVDPLPQQDVQFAPGSVPAEQDTAATPAPEPMPTNFAGSYDQVAAAMALAQKTQAEMRLYAEKLAADDVAEPATSQAAEPNVSGTNLQVQGIDEADIVKSDGEYLYILNSERLWIYRADAANTKLIGQVDLYAGQRNSHALYLMGDTLLVLASEWGEAQRTIVCAYDVSDPANPQLVTEFGQDGQYAGSRLWDGKLYLLSVKENRSYDPTIPETFIPSTIDGGETTLLPAECIWLPDCPLVENFTVVSCFDAVTGALLHTNAVLGNAETAYMTAGSLYLGWSSDVFSHREAPQEDGSVEHDYECRRQTTLLRFDLTNGLDIAAETALDGCLDSQFWLDEYSSYLRLVLTEERLAKKEREYADGSCETTLVEYKKDNSLLILDKNLSQTGRIDSLGRGEQIYSARFEGAYAYFVTFRRTDPLYCVDLSDPARPAVCAQLHLPDFSDYLYLWDKTSLLGLGRSRDESGSPGGRKLAMYDISDPTKLSQIHTLALEEDGAQALYDQKAILVAPERSLIGFPSNSGYQLIGYDPENGFTVLAELGSGLEQNARGLCIDECFYLCTGSGVEVLSLTEMSLICSAKAG